MSVHDPIFDAVFPPSSDLDVPTPAATPVLGSSEFAQPFSSPAIPQSGFETSASQQIEWNRSWHSATSFLSLRDEAIPANVSEDTLKQDWTKPVGTEVARALEHILRTKLAAARSEKPSFDDLLRWYFEEVVVAHYLKHVRPAVDHAIRHDEAQQGLIEVYKHLRAAQYVYVYPLKTCVRRVLPSSEQHRLQEQEEAIRSLFTYSIGMEKLRKALYELFTHQVGRILEGSNEDIETDPMQQTVAEIRQELSEFTACLQSVGLGGLVAQRVFADVMCDALGSHIKSVFSGRWTAPSTIVQELHDWIENDYARLIVELLLILQGWDTLKQDPSQIVHHTEPERWKSMGLKQLGMLRTDELFEIVVDWDETRGAIEDMHAYATSPEARSYLSNTFSDAIGHRLLQPGASTIEILQVYVAIIRAFTVLDPKGVLLDRVARPIRRYLRERDDTVKIVVGGLLADPDAEDLGDPSNTSTALVELAIEMNENPGMQRDDDDDTDFDDMNWLPDPVDAGPDYKKSLNSDVIGSLISLFESRSIFVLDFQKILAERLLKQEYDFDREIRVLELLKVRFGETALQACEVMLRDILDSRRIDASIQKAKPMPKLHARILSHLFWPSMPDENFNVPAEIALRQAAYALSFEELKASRKLTWLNSLGQVTVTLDLEDRTIVETVAPWQAAVIHTFQASSAAESKAKVALTRSVTDISTRLVMNPALVSTACTFWVGKLVLRQSPTQPEDYTVLETLPNALLSGDTEDNAVDVSSTTKVASILASPSVSAATANLTTAAALAAESTSATSSNALTNSQLPGTTISAVPASSKFSLYSPYITGMLTNGGPMPLPQILMMLRVAVPGGFPYPDAELKDYMEDEVREGRLDVKGGVFRLGKEGG